MTDKKSVVIVLEDGAHFKYKGTDEKTYDYQIGEHNGVLCIIEKRPVSSVLTIPDEEEIIVVYAAEAWLKAWQE